MSAPYSWVIWLIIIFITGLVLLGYWWDHHKAKEKRMRILEEKVRKLEEENNQ